MMSSRWRDDLKLRSRHPVTPRLSQIRVITPGPVDCLARVLDGYSFHPQLRTCHWNLTPLTQCQFRASAGWRGSGRDGWLIDVLCALVGREPSAHGTVTCKPTCFTSRPVRQSPSRRCRHRRTDVRLRGFVWGRASALSGHGIAMARTRSPKYAWRAPPMYPKSTREPTYETPQAI
jgi:hypothetical protein